jgi:hypothetical protein
LVPFILHLFAEIPITPFAGMDDLSGRHAELHHFNHHSNHQANHQANEGRVTEGAATIEGVPRAEYRREGVSHARPPRALILGPVSLAAFAAAVVGWSTREEYYFVPSEGLGYALGIAGLAMMLLLLLYSLRKHWSPLHNAGPIQRWFHIHMALGILGPTAILFHSNFQLGSLNATVALACMLTVSLSGFVGRFIYTHVHFEYLGRLASVDELQSEARHEGRVLAAATRRAPEIGEILADFRERSLAPRGGLAARTRLFLTIGHRARVTRRRAMRAYRRTTRSGEKGAPSRRDVRRAVRKNLRAVRRAGEYSAYERAFSLWHALHLPFCVGLFLAAAVHVVAVHMY